MTMEEILEFNNQFEFNAKNMIDFATWWHQNPVIMSPGPTSPDLKDWIDINELNR